MPVAEELEFILSEAAQVLTQAVRTEDIRSVWVGLRPLVAPPEQANGGTKTISREHTIVVDGGNVVTVTGGKWTTYRAMAEDVLDRCFDEKLLPRRPGSITDHHRLVGAPTGAAPATPVYAAPGPHLFGSELPAVQSCPGAERELGMGLTEAMVRFAARHEYAETVEDVLARRWRALFLDAREAASMAPAVAALLIEEHGRDPALAQFQLLCAQYLPPDAGL